MILASRPLRFLVAVVGGWTLVRAAMLWPVEQVMPSLARVVVPPALAETAAPPPPLRVPITAVRRPAFAALPRDFVAAPALPIPRARGELLAPVIRPAAAAQAISPIVLAAVPDPLPPGIDPPPAFRASRWSGSAWAILRPDGRATPFASQLGGSQAGARVAYAIDADRRVAVYARASAAIDAREREAAIGLDWRPTRLPIHLIAEQRIGIEGVRGGAALGVVGGVGPTRLAGPVRVEGYAQAGVIFRDGREGFADGSLRLTVARRRLDLGVGAWGGAQRGAARLDVGPTIGVGIPVAGRTLRASADWRQRVAGDARPGSGPAVSLGVDF